MISATLVNTGAHDSEHWVAVTFPSEAVSGFGVEATFVTDGEEWRAVKGSTHASKTTYRIQTKLGAGQRVTGKLVNQPSHRVEPYKIHKWVTDDISDVLPSLGSGAIDPPQLVESSPAHTRWHIRQRVNSGIILEWWADVLHGDPVVPVWGKIVWSDRGDTSPSKTFSAGSIKLMCGEYLVIDFSERRKLTKPTMGGTGKYIITNEEHLVLDDGVGIPITGRMLAFIDPGAPTGHGDPDLDELQRDISNLRAAATGEVFGVCDEWDGHWLAHLKTPDVSKLAGYIGADFETDHGRFKHELGSKAGMFSKISNLGIGMTPGQTGGQEDFGATKGTYAVSLQKPEWLLALRYISHYELFRQINLYDANGYRLLAENHQGWDTWSGRTHLTSSDRLNKPLPGWPSNGWFGYDDQHRSQNNFCAYALLSDDPLVHDQILHQLEIDRACYRIKYPNYGTGASRAVGRQLQTWANLSTVYKREDWLDLMRKRIEPVSRIHVLGEENVIKVLAIGNPDGRKQVYMNGELAMWTSLWEAGLAMVGLYAVYKQMPENEHIVSVMDRLSETMVNKAWFREDEKHYIVADIVWNNGYGPDSLTKANGWDYKGTNPQTQQFIYTHKATGVTDWTFAGILAARNYRVSRGLSVPEGIDALIEDVTSWANKSHVEWWAM